MITHHTQLLQALIDKHGLKSYLEIGVQNPANNFDKIKCENKWGVDPMVNCDKVNMCTSDDFFSMGGIGVWNFDLIFIDGEHTADQVKRDFENSLKCLSEKGFIVIHDVLPENEEGTLIPRQTKKWWGTVYQFAMEVHQYRLEYKTFNIDEGCMVIQKKPIGWNGTEFVDLPAPVELTWGNYIEHRKKVLRIRDEVII